MTTELQLQKLDRAFDQIDVTGKGELDRDDVIALGSRLILGFGQSPKSAKGKEVLDGYDLYWSELAASADADGSGTLSPAEFRDAMIAAYIEGNRFDQSFLPLALSMAKLSDTDGDGQIARPEFVTLQSAFGTSDVDIDAAFAALDFNADGALTVEELVQATREYYTSPDPAARGNNLFGPL